MFEFLLKYCRFDIYSLFVCFYENARRSTLLKTKVGLRLIFNDFLSDHFNNEIYLLMTLVATLAPLNSLNSCLASPCHPSRTRGQACGRRRPRLHLPAQPAPHQSPAQTRADKGRSSPHSGPAAARLLLLL